MILKGKKTLCLSGELMDLTVPRVMGILNITPDSFYDGGKYKYMHEYEAQILRMIAEGASIIDIGGNSTRPGSKAVHEQEELDRVIPIIEMISKKYPFIKISIDTFRSKVAKNAVESGACMVNDVSGGNIDHDMFSVVSKLNVPYVLTHMRGTPENMTFESNYENLMLEVVDELLSRKKKILNMGAKEVIIDPGFGFSKKINENYLLLNKLSYLDELDSPLLIGISRKSMIYKHLCIDVDDSLNGTTVLNTIALQNGANILRVHDVKQAMEAIKLTSKLTENVN